MSTLTATEMCDNLLNTNHLDAETLDSGARANLDADLSRNRCDFLCRCAYVVLNHDLIVRDAVLQTLFQATELPETYNSCKRAAESYY